MEAAVPVFQMIGPCIRHHQENNLRELEYYRGIRKTLLFFLYGTSLGHFPVAHLSVMALLFHSLASCGLS